MEPIGMGMGISPGGNPAITEGGDRPCGLPRTLTYYDCRQIDFNGQPLRSAISLILVYQSGDRPVRDLVPPGGDSQIPPGEASH